MPQAKLNFSTMVPYCRVPTHAISDGLVTVDSFLALDQANTDPRTVEAFGDEWSRFPAFSEEEIECVGAEYFDIVGPEMINSISVCLDLGCGSGRWSRYLARRVAAIEAVDPSRAVLAAARATGGLGNVRVTQAGYGCLPFAPRSFDFVFSLGVVHHVPDPGAAVREAADMLRPGGWLLLYVYYDLSNTSSWYRAVFRAADALRRQVSALPAKPRFVVADLIAALAYAPLVAIARVLRHLGVSAWHRVPLAYYANKTWRVLRNDALDRFGTPLEQRFSKEQVERMLLDARLEDIRFSAHAPYWHVVARRPDG